MFFRRCDFLSPPFYINFHHESIFSRSESLAYKKEWNETHQELEENWDISNIYFYLNKEKEMRWSFSSSNVFVFYSKRLYLVSWKWCLLMLNNENEAKSRKTLKKHILNFIKASSDDEWWTRNKEPIRVKIDNFRDSGFFLQVIFASSLKNIMIILRDLSASMRVRHDNEIQEHSASRSLFRSTRDDLCSVKLWKFLIVNTSKFRQHSTSILKNLTDSRRNPHSSLYDGWVRKARDGGIIARNQQLFLTYRAALRCWYFGLKSLYNKDTKLFVGWSWMSEDRS